MAKTKSKWVCQNCGYETVSYLGRCPECSQFGTFVEEITSQNIKNDLKKPSNMVFETSISTIKDIKLDEKVRFQTGIDELDRVLGGGLVKGSLLLLRG